MRVLYIIDSLVPAGTERSLAALAPCYASRGVALDVAYLLPRDGLQQELVEAGARLHSVDGRGGRAGRVVRIASLVRELRPDLVHTTLFESDLAGRLGARIAMVPVVSTLTGQKYGPDHVARPGLAPRKVRIAQGLDAATARLTRRLHGVSAIVADSMAARLHYPRNRIDVVHRGRDPEQLGRRSEERFRSARRVLGVGPETDVVLALARHDEPKGLDVLVDAIRELRSDGSDLRVFIAGREGSQTDALARQVRDHQLAEVVTFLGVRSDVPELLCAADVLAMPSRREGLPGALLEAMALETPVVVSDLPEIREVVDERSAVLVPPGRPASLARALRAVLSQPAAASVRAARGRAEFLRRFTIERVADEMLEFYDRALGR